MSVWKNITKDTLRVKLDGNGGKVTEVAPGKNLTLNDDFDFVVGTLINPEQVELVDPDAKPATTKTETETAK